APVGGRPPPPHGHPNRADQSAGPSNRPVRQTITTGGQATDPLHHANRLPTQCLTICSSSEARWIQVSTIDSVGSRRTRSLRPLTDMILAVRATPLRRRNSLIVFTPHRPKSSAYSPPMPLIRIRSATLAHFRRSEVGRSVAFESSARPERVAALLSSASVVRTPALRSRVASFSDLGRMASILAMPPR